MTCAQGLLRLLWGGPEVGVLRDCTLAYRHGSNLRFCVVEFVHFAPNLYANLFFCILFV